MHDMHRIARRLLFPILIVAIAVGVSTFGRTRTAQSRAAVERFAIQVLSGGASGATDPFVESLMRQRLPVGGGLSVEVRDGDGGPAPDGAASHVVMVKRDGLAVTGLRVRYDPDPARMAVVGIFEPGIGPAPATESPAPAAENKE